MLKILGIDPGSRVTGYAILQVTPTSQFLGVSLIESGVFKLTTASQATNEKSFGLRLNSLANQLNDVLLRHNPQVLSIESLIHAKNIQSLTKLAQARGVIIQHFFANKYEDLQHRESKKIVEFAPNAVKATISGFGHSDKTMMQKVISYHLKEDLKFKTHDESDALALALCYIFHHVKGRVKFINSKHNVSDRGNIINDI